MDQKGMVNQSLSKRLYRIEKRRFVKFYIAVTTLKGKNRFTLLWRKNCFSTKKAVSTVYLGKSELASRNETLHIEKITKIESNIYHQNRWSKSYCSSNISPFFKPRFMKIHFPSTFFIRVTPKFGSHIHRQEETSKRKAAFLLERNAWKAKIGRRKRSGQVE